MGKQRTSWMFAIALREQTQGKLVAIQPLVTRLLRVRLDLR